MTTIYANEAIILAGGLGTRLRSAVPELPKCLAPVNGRPFLYYVIEHFKKQGIQKFIFALGYKQEAFQPFFETCLSGVSYEVSVEKEPLGTGGAIKQALSCTNASNLWITNGDTLFTANLHNIEDIHTAFKSNCTLALKPMTNFSRYGVVETDKSNRITAFQEKQFRQQGNINAGLYLLNTTTFNAQDFSEKFSWEKDYLETYLHQQIFTGVVQDTYFIDIGIPEDYERAQKELGNEL